jgi:DNA-binding transcriptional LysR family regulator
MDTDRLKYFCTLVELGSLTKASEILGISHSGLSKAISLLQSEVNSRLVRPQGRGLEITPEGKALYAKSIEVLRLIDNLHMHEQRTNPTVRMGLSEVMAISGSDLLASEIEQPLKIEQCDVGECEELISREEIDFGISFVPQPRPELEYLKLGKVTFNSFAREDLAKKHGEKTPFAVPISDLPTNPMGFKIRDGWPKSIPRNSYYLVKTFATALNLLRNGKAAVYMPDFIAKRENQLLNSKYKIIKVVEQQRATSVRELFLVKAKGSLETREMKKVAKILRKLLADRS